MQQEPGMGASPESILEILNPSWIFGHKIASLNARARNLIRYNTNALKEVWI